MNRSSRVLCLGEIPIQHGLYFQLIGLQQPMEPELYTPRSCTVKMITISVWKSDFQPTTPLEWTAISYRESIHNSMVNMSKSAMIRLWKFSLDKTNTFRQVSYTERKVTCTTTLTAGEQIILFSTTPWTLGLFV